MQNHVMITFLLNILLPVVPKTESYIVKCNIMDH